LAIFKFNSNRKNAGRGSSAEEGKNRVPLTVEFVMENSTLERLINFSRANSLTMAEAAMAAIEKGMDNYWLMAYKSMKQDYARLTENHERCRNDTELLSALEKQNEELEALLRGKGTSKETQKG
jgi:hypothetical protein